MNAKLVVLCSLRPWWLAVPALALGMVGAVLAQNPAPVSKSASASAPAQRNGLDVLAGTWVRPDGGYVIVITSIGPAGELQAMYYNPNPLPFAQARAAREAGVLRVAFELRSGGYNGSTYDLRYDPIRDRLVGTYFQAIARQSFDVQFARK